MWILNGKSNQLLRWSSILHTCSMPRLGAVCERAWWPLAVAYEKEGWKFRDTADLLRLPQADDPHWHAPTARMQTTSELSDFGFQLLGRAVSDRQVVPSCLVSAVLREGEHRDIAQSGEAALNLEGFICMLDAWSLRIKSPRKSQALLTLVMPAGAHVPPSQGAPRVLSLAREAGQAVLHIRCKCDSCKQGPGERQGKPCQSVSSWSDSFSFTKPEPGQSPPWHCASFLVYV